MPAVGGHRRCESSLWRPLPGTFPQVQLPDLLVNLGGKTGVIVDIFGQDSRAQRLLEYRDGAALAQMRVLDRIESGE